MRFTIVMAALATFVLTQTVTQTFAADDRGDQHLVVAAAAAISQRMGHLVADHARRGDVVVSVVVLSKMYLIFLQPPSVPAGSPGGSGAL